MKLRCIKKMAEIARSCATMIFLVIVCKTRFLEKPES